MKELGIMFSSFFYLRSDPSYLYSMGSYHHAAAAAAAAATISVPSTQQSLNGASAPTVGATAVPPATEFSSSQSDYSSTSHPLQSSYEHYSPNYGSTPMVGGPPHPHHPQTASPLAGSHPSAIPSVFPHIPPPPPPSHHSDPYSSAPPPPWSFPPVSYHDNNNSELKRRQHASLAESNGSPPFKFNRSHHPHPAATAPPPHHHAGSGFPSPAPGAALTSRTGYPDIFPSGHHYGSGWSQGTSVS